ncbi:MAG: TIGR03620 family F420-dependent LLM class oxidoreductase [Acidimicrobiia bacterium]|nr:TIGR03620 family F420-dependent LLM class oxidoreductase [Acidimicrobiia bacterium]
MADSDEAPTQGAEPTPTPLSGSSRPPLGRIGAWSGRLQRRPTHQAVEAVAELEELGYQSVWIPESPFGKDVLTFSAVLLGATDSITVATGIANIWARDAVSMMNSARTIGDAHPERFLLGVGISHRRTAETRGHDYRTPVAVMRKYLHAMASAGFDGHDPVWQPPVVLAALGPRMMGLAAELTGGAHPFLAPPEHTATARAILGPNKLLAVEQGVVLGSGIKARERARSNLARYLAWPNYQRHFLRLGFDEVDFTDRISDRLIDAALAVGDEDDADRRIRAHLDAGADHVCVQIVTDNVAGVVAGGTDDELTGYRQLAGALTLD